MSYVSMSEYKLKGFRKSKMEGKKYDALLENKNTGREKVFHFGALGYEQYKDSTGLGLYTHLDHLDPNRRRLYKIRHNKDIKPGYYSSGYFALRFLW